MSSTSSPLANVPDDSPGGPASAESALGARRVIAVSWEEHRRTRELCDWFGIPLHVISFDGGRMQRYLRVGAATLALLWRTRPAVLFLQTPSVMLALLSVLLRPFCGRYRIVMDAHNEAVEPYAYTQWPIPLLHRFNLRCADVTIVTNAALATTIEKLGGRPHVLPDRIPKAPLSPRDAPAQQSPFQVMVVATYAADEPIAEIIDAARALGPEFQFHITGRETKLPAEQRARLPANVRQTGFLPEHDYWVLMARSHAVLDFTLKPNCLVCGAYEGLALHRPMILSDNPATVDLFGKVAVFPGSHSAQDIAAAVRECASRYDELRAVASLEEPRFSARWLQQAKILAARMNDWVSAA